MGMRFMCIVGFMIEINYFMNNLCKIFFLKYLLDVRCSGYKGVKMWFLFVSGL